MTVHRDVLSEQTAVTLWSTTGAPVRCSLDVVAKLTLSSADAEAGRRITSARKSQTSLRAMEY